MNTPPKKQARKQRISRTDASSHHPHSPIDSPVIIEDSGDVLSRKRIGGIRDEQARFTYGSVSNYDALDVLHDAVIWWGLIVLLL